MEQQQQHLIEQHQQHLIEQHQQQHLIEQRQPQTTLNRDGLSSLLKVVSAILMVVGLVIMLTSNGSGPSQSSSRLSDLSEKLPYIVSGMMTLFGLISLGVAYSLRKDSKGLVAVFLVLSLTMFLLAWYSVSLVDQAQIVPVSH